MGLENQPLILKQCLAYLDRNLPWGRARQWCTHWSWKSVITTTKTKVNPVLCVHHSLQDPALWDPSENGKEWSSPPIHAKSPVSCQILECVPRGTKPMVPAHCTVRDAQPEVLTHCHLGSGLPSQPWLQAAKLPDEQKASRPLHQLFSEPFYSNISGLFSAAGSKSGIESLHTVQSHWTTYSSITLKMCCHHGWKGAAWSPDMHFLRKANKITLSVFKKSCNFSAWIMIFFWEAELFGKETVILSSTGRPIAVLWNTLAETAPLWLYREISLFRQPWIILQLSVCNGDCKNAFDVRILVSGKAGTSMDLRSLCALRNSQHTAINKVHWQRGSGHHL